MTEKPSLAMSAVLPSVWVGIGMARLGGLYSAVQKVGGRTYPR
ncbi:hypothetical protein [Moraxella lacunata]